jgi:ArsR family transcriptional regulator
MITRAPILDRLAALADPTRSRLLLLLDGHELTVSELCAVLQLPQSTVSRHLRILSDEGWVASRGEGTSRWYSMAPAQLEPGARELWEVVRAQIAETPSAAQDARRVAGVVAQRRTRSQLFFATTAAEGWDHLRAEMIGTRADLLALLHLLDERLVVGDLGCGTGHLAAALAPCVARVVGVDESRQMLAAARERLAGAAHVELREGTLEALPIADAELDVAILFLVTQFVPDPAAAMREVRRVLRPEGKLLVVDLIEHDRTDYVLQLGHVWQGFDESQMAAWLGDAGFHGCRWHELPPDPAARGPALFACTARR